MAASAWQAAIVAAPAFACGRVAANTDHQVIAEARHA
jgi:hypothetical protein